MLNRVLTIGGLKVTGVGLVHRDYLGSSDTVAGIGRGI